MMLIQGIQAQYCKAAPISACRDFAEQTNRGTFFLCAFGKKSLVFLKNARFGAVQVAFAFGPNKKFAVS